MPTDKTAIAEALETLDHKDDNLWTDDGAPKVEAVQRICNDTKITRAQINEALPGFQRKSTTAIDEQTQAPVETKVEAPVAAAPAPAEEGDVELDDILDGSGTEEDLRAIAQRSVDDAHEYVNEKRKARDQANRDVAQAEARLGRAMALFAAKFPPISAAANIKAHLAASQAALHERVTGQPIAQKANPIDHVLQDRKRDNGRNRLASGGVRNVA